MDKYVITSYSQALDRIRSNGYIWNVGQIAPNVLSAIYWAISKGEIKEVVDGYPLRGEGGERKKLFELTAFGKMLDDKEFG